jgi:hypothetical protein
LSGWTIATGSLEKKTRPAKLWWFGKIHRWLQVPQATGPLERSTNMTTSPLARLERLEEWAGPGGECPRCSGTTVIIANDEVESVSFATGRRLPPDEAEAFEREEEEEGGRCPICGQTRHEVTVGSWG